MLVAAGGALAAVVATDTTPELGLDLQGGLSVVLAPVDEGEEGDLGDKLDKSLDIVRDRVDALGVAEPDISRQGDTILVELPGVEEQERARDLIGTTAELQFRPVLNVLPAGAQPGPPPGGSGTAPAGSEGSGDTGGSGGTGGTGGDAAGDAGGEAGPGAGGGEQGLGASGGAVLGQSDEGGTDEGGTDGGGTGEETTTTGETTPTTLAGEQVEAGQEFDADQPIVAEGRDGELLYQLGPAEVTGEVVDDAQARFAAGQWAVDVDFTGEGSDQWDEMAARYVGQQVAIVLDGVVQSAPTIQTAQFEGSAQITGDFSEGDAKDLALVLRFGALPVELEEISVQEVSASLGRDTLDAGIVAGMVGLGLVALYMIVYYRVLGFVVWLSLAVTGAAVYAIVSWLGQAISLTLTLAGVVGLIVAIGVAVDSNIVYFERLKEEMRKGRTVRSAARRGFRRAFRTIVTADVVTLLGAGLLWLLAIGSVKGFAFYLGLVTFLDLVVSYFFMHPLVMLIGNTRGLAGKRWLGVRRVAGTEAEAAPT